MRLFVAIEAGRDVSERATAVAVELARRVASHAPHARLTWVQPSRLHLTLRFIGEVPDRQVDTIERALSTPIAIAPFDVTFGGIRVMPPYGPPRVISAGVTGGAREVAALAREVDTRLAAAGVPPEPRPFRAHLTLARIRAAAGLRAASLVQGLADASLGCVRVTGCALVESRLLPQGPDHIERATTRLGA